MKRYKINIEKRKAINGLIYYVFSIFSKITKKSMYNSLNPHVDEGECMYDAIEHVRNMVDKDNFNN